MLVEARSADNIPVSVLTQAYIRCLLRRVCYDDDLPCTVAAEPCSDDVAEREYHPLLWGSSTGSDDDDGYFVAFDSDTMPMDDRVVDVDPCCARAGDCTFAAGTASLPSSSSKFFGRMERMALHVMIRLQWMAECLERQGLALDRAAETEVKHIARLFLCTQDRINSILGSPSNAGENNAEIVKAIEEDCRIASSSLPHLEGPLTPQKGKLSSSPPVSRGVQAVRRASHQFEKGAESVRAAFSTSSTIQRGLGVMRESSQSFETGLGTARELAQVCTENALVKAKAASVSASDKLHGGLHAAAGRMRVLKGAVQRIVLYQGGA
eukprot:TRINITY_DN64291_c0_g1_i1.p1 TRINITY_DN64291_c0_g1~~TRINITY_DN64291_c0_g1_i1.p1  ORF type:complete len:323 (-),score=61.59 TRINITY_DN64291_c0_g1_i1:54-1022(-)